MSTVLDRFVIGSKSRTPIVLYGGTFDPIHKGHIHAALSVLESLDVDTIHMVLSARPGHRGEPAATVVDRWQMLSLVCESITGLVADDQEIVRGGTSYTYDSVLEYESLGYVPNWVVGVDSFLTMADWHRWREIFDHANLVVIDRPGFVEEPCSELADVVLQREVAELDVTKPGQIWMKEDAMLNVSATQVRERIRNGVDAMDLLEDAVWSYIRQHNLYVEVSV